MTGYVATYVIFAVTFLVGTFFYFKWSYPLRNLLKLELQEMQQKQQKAHNKKPKK